MLSVVLSSCTGLSSIISQAMKRRGDADTEASDVASWLKERLKSDAATSVDDGSRETVSTWLKTCKLDRYSIAIAKEGYDDVVFLQDADEKDIDDLVQKAGMLKAHVKTFKKEWMKLKSQRKNMRDEL